MTPLPLNRAYDPAYGAAVALSPLITRVLARNPSPFTFHGTGTYLVGTDALAVIDPGPADEAHLDAILAGAAGRPITHILVTHTHSDHSPLAAALKARTGARSFGFGPHGSGHDESAAKVEEGGDMAFMPDERVAHGDVIAGEGFSFEALHTPGHTSNHLCFALREEAALFPGDHVMGWSTTVVSPPDGDMRAYMASLDLLAQRDERVFYPTHGAPIGGPHDAMARRPQDFVRALSTHRQAREAQVLAQLQSGQGLIREMVPVLYAETDKRLHPAAALSLYSHMLKLVAEGRARTDGPARLDSLYRLN